MAKFEFTVIASGLDPQADDYEARFYDGACGDATVSFQNGHTILDFEREADSLTDAIISAVHDASNVGATLEAVEPDPLVSLSQMASRSGMSRAAMTNYFKGHRQEGFPAPKRHVTSQSPLWDWGDIAQWLYRQGRLSREEALSAGIVSAANEILERGVDRLPEQLAQRTIELEAELA